MIDFGKSTIEELKKVYNSRLNDDYYYNQRMSLFRKTVDGLCGDNVSKYAKKLYENNGGLPLTMDTTEGSFRKNLSNWKNGTVYPPFVKNLHSEKTKSKEENRVLFIDLLLYLGLQKKFKVNKLSGFNNELKKFGIEPLYELDFFDFCVAVSIHLEEKNGTEAYKTYRQLISDQELCKEAKTEISGQGKVTLKITEDFNNINAVGDITDIVKKDFSKKTAYSFVKLYAPEFGRRHISRYFAFAALLAGSEVDSIVNHIQRSERVNVVDWRILNLECSRPIQDIISNQLGQDLIQNDLFLMGEDLFIGAVEYLYEDMIDFYENSENGYRLDEKLVKSHSLSEEQQNEEIANHRTRNNNVESGNVIRTISSNDFIKMIKNEMNIPRELMLMTLLAVITKKTIKKYVDRYQSKRSAIERLIKVINIMLHQCRMAKLDEKISQYDFLLLTAIYKTDYEELFDDETNLDSNPYKKYLTIF